MGDADRLSDAELFDPELFRYEAFFQGGLTSSLRALEKISRLAALAQRGLHSTGQCVGDDALMVEVSEAVSCAAMHARVAWEKGSLSTEEGARDGDDATT